MTCASASKPRIPALLAAVVATLLAVTLLGGPASADTIIYKAESGKQPKHGVTVKSETADKIKWVPQGARAEKEESAFDVQVVEYDDAPDEFKRGVNYFRKGSWYDAMRNLETALSEARAPVPEDEFPTVRRWWVEQYANFYIAECHRERAPRHKDELEKAVTRYQEVLDITPPSRFTGDALIGLGLTYAIMGDNEKALATLDRAIDMASKRQIAPSYVVAARQARADVQLAAGNISGAASDFHKLAGEVASRDPEGAVRYMLAAAFANLEGGNAAKAQSEFESIRAAHKDSSHALAGASNGLGLIALSRKDARRAREHFANTLAHYGANAEEYERALRGMADTLRMLTGKEQGAEELAEGYLRELRLRNPRSPFLDDQGGGR